MSVDGGHVAPLVSIITPSFNQARFLPETLRSVAVQGYPAIEHIVMDGGSTDGSVEILKDWAKTHSLTWVSEPDRGQADAISRGVAMAKGDIVAWLNSDDTYLDACVISDVVAAFADGAKIVTGAGWYLTEAGERDKYIPVLPKRVDHATLRYVDWILQPATFVERELFMSCPIDTSLHYAFDWDLFIRLTAKAKVKVIRREIAGYRRHEAGKTISGGSKRQRELLAVTRRYHRPYSRTNVLLTLVTFGHAVATRLPRRLGALSTFFLNKFAVLTQRMTNGRGIQY